MLESPLGSTISSRHFIYGYLSYTLRVEFAHKSVVCRKCFAQKLPQGLLRVYNPRVSQKVSCLARKSVKEKGGQTNRQKFRANEPSFATCLRPHKTRSNGINARGIHSSLILSRQSLFWLSTRALTLIYITLTFVK